MHQFRFAAVGPMCVIALAALLATTTSVAAQGARPLGATVSPGAIGPAAPTPVPIGGLRTRPLASATPTPGRPRHDRVGTWLLSVADAPLARGGVVVNLSDNAYADADAIRFAWIPTAERPRWTRDSTVSPVQAWRDLIVTDVVCNGAGRCLERRQRIRAPWIARCSCYAFADGWNRIWRAEGPEG